MRKAARNSLAAAVLLSAASLAASAAGAAPPVGFVWHYPYVRFEDDKIPQSGATALICRGNIGVMREDGSFDWPQIDGQLDLAESWGVSLVQLIEAGPVHSSDWLRRKTKESGEAQTFFNGEPADDPSFASPIYGRYRERFTTALAQRIRERDKTGTVIAYTPGCEWWYTADVRASHLDLAAFRQWLSRKYGRIEALNTVWGSSYRSFSEVQNPGLVPDSAFGNTLRLARFVPARTSRHDVSWSIHQPHWVTVEPGKTYVFSAWVRTSAVMGEGACLSIAWWSDGGAVRVPRDDFSDRLTGSNDWRRLELKARAPNGADRAWLLLKLIGAGAVWFDDLEFRPEGSQSNLAPCPDLEKPQGYAGPWFADNWTKSKTAAFRWTRGEGRNGSACLSIRVLPVPDDSGVRNLSAAAYDSERFACEFFADYMQGFCAEVKRADPTRPTAGYLTYAFANPVEWDYVQNSAMSLGVVLPRLRDLDIIGMQICSADGDPIRVTGSLDLARKYGKPMWAVDLLDFTSGVAIGVEAMRKVTQAAIQHGASGIFYYCWNGTPDYNYHPGMTLDELRVMQTEAVRSIEAVKGMKVKSPMALIQPILPTAHTDPGGQKNDFRDFAGLYKALLDLRFTCDIWTIEELERPGASLAGYAAVIVPDCAFISDLSAEVLRRYSARGLVLNSGRWATYDERGFRRTNPPALRCAQLGDRFGVRYLGPIVRTTHAGNTPPLFIETGSAERRAEVRRDLRAELRRVLFPALKAVDAEVIGDYPDIKLSVFESRGRRALFLVNYGTSPARNVRVRLKQGWILGRCGAQADGTPKRPARVTRRSGCVEITAPEFRHSCILMIGG